MVNFQRIEPLPHIVIEREPEEQAYRPRQARGPSIQPRTNRKEHSESIKQQTTTSVEKLSELRKSFGVIPGRLLVLRLVSFDVDQR